VRVTAALLARYAEVETEGGLLNIIGGGTDVFGVPALPVSFSMPFALQLRFDEAEAGQTFQVGMIIRDPQLESIGGPTEFPIVPTLSEYHAEGWEGVFCVAGVVGLYAEEPGTHSVGIQIDGAERGDIPFQLVLMDDAV
jgi:hypothetical protein